MPWFVVNGGWWLGCILSVRACTVSDQERNASLDRLSVWILLSNFLAFRIRRIKSRLVRKLYDGKCIDGLSCDQVLWKNSNRLHVGKAAKRIMATEKSSWLVSRDCQNGWPAKERGKTAVLWGGLFVPASKDYITHKSVEKEVQILSMVWLFWENAAVGFAKHGQCL